MKKEKRSVLQFRIDPKERYRFHMACLKNHRLMTDVLVEFVKSYSKKGA